MPSRKHKSNQSVDFAALRAMMVTRQIEQRGITDSRVLKAMRTVPREQFVHRYFREDAYADNPLPIGYGQTISQPYIVALMGAALQLRGTERVLEIGTGSGYAAAVLSFLAEWVYTIERVEKLAARASRALVRLEYQNVFVRAGDGTLGWAEHAPYDAIVVTAGGPVVPQALKEQLTSGGRLVMPVGKERIGQTLVRVTRTEVDQYDIEDLGTVQFVPLIGEQGWALDKWDAHTDASRRFR